METGGPAFAAGGHPGQQHIQQEGMTMRDYFAAKAMSALLSDGNDYAPDGIARDSYDIADAMLKARSAHN